MGVDPLDGGDSRRAFTRNDDGTISMIGRDTVFTLCDSTDRAVVAFHHGVVADRSLTSDTLVITCSNTGATVTLKARYVPTEPNVLRETVTTPDGAPVDTILFHRISASDT
jgi:hypothetical protein